MKPVSDPNYQIFSTDLALLSTLPVSRPMAGMTNVLPRNKPKALPQKMLDQYTSGFGDEVK
ncbi:hypothetical protein [Mesorhizobium sp. WSM3860]|uniref:hypothetical protein n=1 Tax=Mesorhizobium sp. WSM3860 TaxID=2029403 RepID=UPI001140FCB8|nr:hypothetical protein [Mesorhizobium sp. WSM3860]